jgi:hypothetical protein
MDRPGRRCAPLHRSAPRLSGPSWQSPAAHADLPGPKAVRAACPAGAHGLRLHAQNQAVTFKFGKDKHKEFDALIKECQAALPDA